jgi:DNA-binding NtrC family response regulator
MVHVSYVQERIIMAKREETQSASIRLLLIDDEVGYVNVLSNRLSKRNFQVGKATSGTEAFQILRKRDFDVAVLDLKMEDMDGIEILRILKKMAPELVVIMLTGHGSAEAAREGIKQGAYDYLTKPCELDELIQKIQEAYNQRSAA